MLGLMTSCNVGLHSFGSPSDMLSFVIGLSIMLVCVTLCYDIFLSLICWALWL